ncbi:hypothetical protein [Adhaeribacter radiodurans]|uniref:Uncharacterized protein n=1 Tax=Adhaeribacter radiodurans TaxID=2745197 RepID=A0A7L7L4Y0_9BACT|nr:hypothetical protein [Adhaeribacter radiodurans]QMU27824.1 hypothetical protein HUW48_07085 [Adhaeribacter radiodurans]
MKKLFSFLFENLLQLIYFIAFESALYFGLQYLLFDQPFTQDTKDPTIVPRWVSVVYFILIYLAVIIGAMLVLNNLVPRKHKHQITRWFWLALALILPLLIILLNSQTIPAE